MSDLLFDDVPRNKTRLEIAMEKHTIWTQDAGWGDKDFPRWIAVLMKPVWKLGYGVKEGDDIPTCYMHVGRLIDEGEYSGYGATEMEAVLEVCRLNKIIVVL